MNYNKKRNEQLLENFGNIKEDSFDFELIESYFRKKDNSGVFQVLSDKTCNDLDFQELFMFLDRTHSRVGQQFLYNKLRCIPHTPNHFEKLTAEFTQNPEFRLSVQNQLTKLNEDETFYISSLFQDELIKPPKWYFLVRLLALTSLVSVGMLFFFPSFVFILLLVFIINLAIHYWNKKNLYHYFGSVPQLLKLNRVAHELFKNKTLQQINPDLGKSLEILDKVRNRMFYFNFESKFQADTQVFLWTIFELIKVLLLIEPLFLFGSLRRIDTKRKEIEDVFVFVGQVDAIQSIASLRKGLAWYCIPQIREEQKTIEAVEIHHPLIIDCVKNSIYVYKRSVLLTGSNMAGKTSFIRAIGLNVITGLTLNTCFAKQFVMPRMKVFSAIRISDDLMNDKSYYFEEVLTIKEMIDQSKEEIPNLFLLDEIFKGTNTIERISAGKAVLSALNQKNNIVFVSTHDIELADLLRSEYDLYHFSEMVQHKSVDFDYKLKEGKLKNRNAIRILQINNYPDEVISEAMEISKELDRNTITL